MKKVYLILIVVLLAIIGIICLFYFYYFSPTPSLSASNSQTYAGPRINVTESNLLTYLSLTEFVQDLPSSAKISLITTDKEYSIGKGSATEGHVNAPDITISIPSSYVPQLNNGFCSTLENAKNHGDLKIQFHISKLSAVWKYSSIYKYKSCLGF